MAKKDVISGMKQKNFTWYGRDGLAIFSHVWQPESGFDIKGVICLIHGLGEHSGRYKHFAQFFTDNGYAVIACDLRGHGKSAGSRGHISNYDVLLTQIDRLLEESSKRFPGEPKFIYGHSMGGNIVLNHALLHNPRVLGIIISAPWIRTIKPVPASKMLLANLMNFVFPTYKEKNKIDTSLLSRDAKVVAAYENDELVHNKISARLFRSITTYAEVALEETPTLDIPALLMHGTKDGLTDHTASAELATLAPNYITYKEWPGFYHELHNEPEQEEVFKYVLKWMNTRLDGTIRLSTASF